MNDLDRYIKEFCLDRNKFPKDKGETIGGVIACGKIVDMLREIDLSNLVIHKEVASLIAKLLVESDFSGAINIAMKKQLPEDLRYIRSHLGLYNGAQVVTISDLDDGDEEFYCGTEGQIIRINANGGIDVRFGDTHVMRDIDPHSVQIDWNAYE